jgi:hypothetical protein
MPEQTQPPEGIYERNDPVYAEWLAANPHGFVFLARTNSMHRASCRCVRPLLRPERQQNWLAGVWVSRAVAKLDHDLSVICEYADRCTRCKPGEDIEGIEMLAGYLRRMRGEEPPLS